MPSFGHYGGKGIEDRISRRWTVVPPVSGNETGGYRETGQGIIGNRGRQPSGTGTDGYRETGQIYRAKSAKQKAVPKTNYLLLTK